MECFPDLLADRKNELKNGSGIAFPDSGMNLTGYVADVAKDPYRFDDIDSHRTMPGARPDYTADSQFTPYPGIAWEHEFSGKQKILPMTPVWTNWT